MGRRVSADRLPMLLGVWSRCVAVFSVTGVGAVRPTGRLAPLRCDCDPSVQRHRADRPNQLMRPSALRHLAGGFAPRLPNRTSGYPPDRLESQGRFPARFVLIIFDVKIVRVEAIVGP